ncbi:glycosyltransferase family 4 protein [Candidatus Falkowbacteria bacterium]|jgi:phosphatidyl-myo-inositol dimannoside synthase|nr:glycosyltransferase family 4 protein [Candidatus Falkowbacteria bacterium]MBT5502889.1 glycosyltransferase family 4 protein [Candidatus Falkowbacteria bacterium]MBT6573747.1 glycosyltransferase family 4 protein [Candidatus Falkowbacteria bacterium]MBT7349123.1 glycosyltransferase family 4 protein [Candidatus Falkowbacteria bacterium]MBT7500075.1 glycosyltransferase family 4 protein [Candidatus Falkowbacteria bacterium]
MKRTLLITIDFPPMFGGVANYWSNLCRQLPADNFVVLASEYNNTLDFDIKQNYLIYRKNIISNLKWMWPKWLPLFWHTWRLVRQEKIQRLIVAHVLPTGTVAYLMKKIFKIPYLISVHGLDVAMTQVRPRKRWLLRLICRNASGVVTNSKYTHELLNSICSISQPVSTVYPCPNFVYENIDSDRLEEFKKSFKLHNKKILLTVGRLVERKGHDKVIAAMQRVIQKFPNVVYLIVGQGPELDKLKNQVKGANLGESVLFFSDVMNKEVPLFYHLSDIFIMPSRQLDDGDIEGFGIVYLEANCYGKPVIAGRAGGAVEAVEEGVNGLLVNPLSESEIAKAIFLLLQNPRRAQELGQRGKLRVEQKFNWSEQSKKLIKLLN